MILFIKIAGRERLIVNPIGNDARLDAWATDLRRHGVYCGDPNCGCGDGRRHTVVGAWTGTKILFYDRNKGKWFPDVVRVELARGQLCACGPEGPCLKHWQRGE